MNHINSDVDGVLPAISHEAVDTMDEIGQELREKGCLVCKQILGGSWKKLKSDEFQIQKISGGLSNYLYACSLPAGMECENGEPRKVLLRIYGAILQGNSHSLVVDSVVFALLSEKNIGPKLYGVFEGGRIEEYIYSCKTMFHKSRCLTTSELARPDVSAYCASFLASIHQLDMPICKEPKWLFDTIGRWVADAQNIINMPEAKENELLMKLKSFNLDSEFQCLQKLLTKTQSPVVFCHNDAQEGNVLYLEDVDGSFQLKPIDYEYASYNYRGHDLGNHLCEWCYDYTYSEYPFFSGTLDKYPNKEQQLSFIRAYLEGSKSHNNNEDEVNRLLKEINTFALSSHFLWGVWSIVQYRISRISFGYLEYAIMRLEHYFQQKQDLPKLLEEYIKPVEYSA